MIPIIAAAGYRVIVPDLVGFGRSDKPARREDYTYQHHVDWMRGLVLALDLQRTTLVGQDWGGFIGLRLAAEHAVFYSSSDLLRRDLLVLSASALVAVALGALAMRRGIAS